MKRAYAAIFFIATFAWLVVPPASAARQKAASATPRATAPQPVQDGVAEARLIAIYKLVGQARTREALAEAEKLVSEYPHFQLAQLVYGDLLASRNRPLRQLGDVPDTTAKAGATALAELREESQMRLKALRERPPAGAIPSQFLALAPKSRHAIAVDASRSRLYLFENSEAGLKLVSDYYISVGKSGIEKSAEGDLRTPLGVYYVTSNLDPKSLKDFYGAGALPINYPNPYDLRRGRSGSGIWLHGTPPGQFSRPPKATDGCVVLANPDLQRIIKTVEVRATPVVIAQQLQWVAPGAVQADRQSFEKALESWRAAKSRADLPALLTHYAADFNSYGKSLADWTPGLQSDVARLKGKAVQLKDLSLLQWKDGTDTMVVTFGEIAVGARTGTTRRQYWMRNGAQWKIFFEGVIG